MITGFFGKAVEQQEDYLMIVPAPKVIKMPQIQGIRRKRMTNRGAHLNPFLLESDMDLFNIHEVTQRDKRRTTFRRPKPIVNNDPVPFNLSSHSLEDQEDSSQEEEEHHHGNDFVIEEK